MKNNLIKSTLVVGTFLLSGVSIAQKKNETSAAVAYKTTFTTAWYKEEQDIPAAKKALIEAKKYIDLAVEHVETKESPKTLMLKGSIYSSFLMVGAATNDTVFANLAGKNALEDAISSYKKGFTISDKFDEEITDNVKEKYMFLDAVSMGLYKSEKYHEAAEMYSTQAKLYDAINLLDSNSIFNAALCYSKANEHQKAGEKFESLAKVGYKGADTYVSASIAYRNAQKLDDAKRIVAEGRAKFPMEKDLLLESVNICLDAKDVVGAEAVLSQAVAADPKNKYLQLQIGLVYSELKQTEKAEEAFNKCIEIDPTYDEGLKQLGVHLINTSIDLNSELNKLNIKDPKFKPLDQKIKDTYTKSLIPLEKYIVMKPNDSEVLMALYQVNKFLGNMEKYSEYKKRYDASK